MIGSPQITLVGTIETALELNTSGSSVVLPVDPVACQALATAMNETPARFAQDEVCLRVESIKGSFPAVLNVYVSLVHGDGTNAHSQHLVGTLGLYGVEQASRKDKYGAGGQGMGFTLDISQTFKNLKLAGPPTPKSICVAIVPAHPLHKNARIRIGKISLFHVRKH